MSESEQTRLCFRTIAWCKENGADYPGDYMLVPAFNFLRAKDKRIAELEAEVKEKAKEAEDNFNGGIRGMQNEVHKNLALQAQL